MASSITHKFNCAVPDGPDAAIVRPSNWNDNHDLTIEAPDVSVTTTGFSGIFDNTTDFDTVQKCLDAVDDVARAGMYFVADASALAVFDTAILVEGNEVYQQDMNIWYEWDGSAFIYSIKNKVNRFNVPDTQLLNTLTDNLKMNGVALSPSPAPYWDSEGIRGGCPIQKIDSTYYMLHNGWNSYITNGTNVQRHFHVGLATSTDLMTWTKYGTEPIISDSILPPGCEWIFADDIFYENSTYYMFCQCRKTGSLIGDANGYQEHYYTSTDLLTWTYGGFLFDGQTLGITQTLVPELEYEFAVVTNASVVKHDNIYYCKVDLPLAIPANLNGFLLDISQILLKSTSLTSGWELCLDPDGTINFILNPRHDDYYTTSLTNASCMGGKLIQYNGYILHLTQIAALYNGTPTSTGYSLGMSINGNPLGPYTLASRPFYDTHDYFVESNNPYYVEQGVAGSTPYLHIFGNFTLSDGKVHLIKFDNRHNTSNRIDDGVTIYDRPVTDQLACFDYYGSIVHKDLTTDQLIIYDANNNVPIGLSTTADSAVSNGLFIEKTSVAGKSVLVLDVYGGSPGIVTRRANGTKTSPTQILNTNQIFSFASRPWLSDTASFATSANANVSIFATEDITSTSRGCGIQLTTTPNGSAAPLAAAIIGQDQSLTVYGQIESTVNGFKFPDDTIQTTAAEFKFSETVDITAVTPTYAYFIVTAAYFGKLLNIDAPILLPDIQTGDDGKILAIYNSGTNTRRVTANSTEPIYINGDVATYPSNYFDLPTKESCILVADNANNWQCIGRDYAKSTTDLSTAVLLAGRATPQTIAFGTAESATTGYLTSTSNATKGSYALNAAGTLVVNEANARLELGLASPAISTRRLHVQGASANDSGIRQYRTDASASNGGCPIDCIINDGAAMAAGDRLGFIVYQGAEDSSNTIVTGCIVDVYTTEAWDSTHNGTEYRISTVGTGVDGSTAANRTVKLKITGRGNISLPNQTVPASATAAGEAGEVVVTDGYIYLCTATNTWKRWATNFASW